jgi:hypothetical protein
MCQGIPATEKETTMSEKTTRCGLEVGGVYALGEVLGNGARPNERRP